MAKSGDHAERFLQEIRAQLVSEGEPAGAIMETWMSLTPQEQVRLLLQILQGKTSPEETRSDQDPEPPAEREQRQGSSRMLEKDGETKMEIMEKQRQLISQIIEDTKKVWEETQRERKETSHLLKTKMELQQDASRLTSEDYDSVKIKLQKFHENMGKLLDNLEVKLTYIQSERAQLEIMKLEVKTERENMERDRKLVKAEMDAMTNIRKSADQKMKELDGKLQIIRTEIRELEVISSEVEIKKKDLVKMIRKSRQKKEDISKLNEKKEEVLEEMGDRKTQSGVQRSELEAMEDITELQQHNRSREITSENNNMTSDMQMEDPDEEEIQEIFHTKQCWKNLEEERSQMKWMNFQVMKKRRELSHQLEKTTRERDELEIMKIKLLHQKQEVDRRMDNIIHTAMTLTEIKDNMKKCAAEMNLTKTEIIKTQKTVEENNSEVKNFKDKLRSIKDLVSRWMTQSTSNKTLSANPWDENPCKSQKDETSGNAGNKHEAENQIAEEAVSLKHGMISEDHEDEQQDDEVIREEWSCVLETQTDTQEKTLIVDQETTLLVNVREKIEIEKQISKLKEQEEEMKVKIQHDTENIMEQGKEMRRLMTEIDELQSQRPNTETQIREKQNEEGAMFKEIKHKYVLISSTNVLKQKIMQLEMQDEAKREPDCIKHESKQDMQTQTEGTERVNHEKKLESSDLYRLWLEICRTQDTIRMVKLESGYQTKISKSDMESEYGDIEGVLQEMKELQELLKMVKTAMEQKKLNVREEIRSMKAGVNRKRRELDQRLEKTLRERGELDILKIKIQRQSEETQQKMEKIEKYQSSIKKMAAKIREKNEEMEFNIRDMEIKLRMVQDLNSTVEATKQQMEHIYLLISKEWAELGKFRSDVRKRKEREYVVVREKTQTEPENSDTELPKDGISEEEQVQKQEKETERVDARISQHQTAAEAQNMDILTENSKRQQEELHLIKREMREVEVLKSELQIKTRENQQVLRKTTRQKKENEMILNEIKEKTMSLRRETKKRRRELDRRLEKTLRERDALEVLRLKMKQPNVELVVKKVSVHEKTSVIKVHSEIDSEHLERTDIASLREESEVIDTSSKLADSINDVHNIKQQICVHLETIRREIKILEEVNVHLGKQRQELQTLKAHNMNMRENMSRLNSQIKRTMHAETRVNEMVQINSEIQRQKEGLDISLEKLKRERNEMEVLMTELEIKKRENQQIVRKNIRKEQEVQRVWDEIQAEKDALKRESQRKKKDLDQRLERIIRERDAVEIMKLKFKKEAEEFRMMEKKTSAKTQFPKQTEKHDVLIQICIDRHERIKTQTDVITAVMESLKQQIQIQAEIITTSRKDSESIRSEMKGIKTIIVSALRIIKAKKMVLEEAEKREKEEDQTITNKSSVLDEKETELETEAKTFKPKMMMLKTEKHRADDKERQHHETDENDKLKTKGRNESNLTDYEDQIIKQKTYSEKEKGEKKELEEEKAVKFGKTKMKTHTKKKVDDVIRKTCIKETEKLDLKEIESGIQNQYDMLEQARQALKDEREQMEIIKTELEKKREEANSLFEDIIGEKRKLNDLNLHVKTQRQQLEDAMETMVLKEKERQIQHEEFTRQTQELETKMKKVEADRQELDALVESTNTMKEQVETDMINIQEEKEQVSQIKMDIDKDRDMLLSEKERLEEEWFQLKTREEQLLKDMASTETLKMKLKQLKERMTDNFRQRMVQLQQNNEGVQKLYNVLEEKLVEFQRDIKRFQHKIHSIFISTFEQMSETESYDMSSSKLMQQEKDNLLITHCDKASQTELLYHDDAEKNDWNSYDELELERYISRCHESDHTFEEKQKSTEDKVNLIVDTSLKKHEREGPPSDQKEPTNVRNERPSATIKMFKQEDAFTSEEKRDCLRKIWKDTRIERQEISQMKHRGQEIKNNLEKRLKVINRFVKRTLFHKEKTSMEKQAPTEDILTKSDWDKDRKSLIKKYAELHQLKVCMLSEMENLYVTEKVSKTVTTTEKANQTSQEDLTPCSAVREEEMRVEVTEAAPEASSGLFRQLQHYCCRCCCRCCSCQKHVCSAEK